jgi:hypothetical protein
MLSIRVESATTRFRASGGVATSMGAPMAATAALAAYGAAHKQLPTADARGDVQGSQCAWSPPV